MPNWALLMGFVTLQRGLELVWARRNEAALRRAGAFERGRTHYPLIVGLHLAWLLWLWRAAEGRSIQAPFLALFLLLQVARAWILLTLGPRWTTRILVLPGEALVRKGPYRWVRHPNYLLVALEIPTVPLCFGLWGAAAVFGLLNVAVLALRIRVENTALAEGQEAAA